jgi:hypothetical protein
LVESGHATGESVLTLESFFSHDRRAAFALKTVCIRVHCVGFPLLGRFVCVRWGGGGPVDNPFAGSGATQPDGVRMGPLRQEAVRTLKELGWSKAGDIVVSAGQGCHLILLYRQRCSSFVERMYWFYGTCAL